MFFEVKNRFIIHNAKLVLIIKSHFGRVNYLTIADIVVPNINDSVKN